MIDLAPPPPSSPHLSFIRQLQMPSRSPCLFLSLSLSLSRFSFSQLVCVPFLSIYTSMSHVFHCLSAFCPLLFLPHCRFHCDERQPFFSSGSSRIPASPRLFFLFHVNFPTFFFFFFLSHCLCPWSAIFCPCQSPCLRDIPDIITAFDYPPDWPRDGLALMRHKSASRCSCCS